MSPVRRRGRQDASEPQRDEPDCDKRQPYAKEHEEYSGDGVVRPPEEKAGKRKEPSAPRKP